MFTTITQTLQLNHFKIKPVCSTELNQEGNSGQLYSQNRSPVNVSSSSSKRIASSNKLNSKVQSIGNSEVAEDFLSTRVEELRGLKENYDKLQTKTKALKALTIQINAKVKEEIEKLKEDFDMNTYFLILVYRKWIEEYKPETKTRKAIEIFLNEIEKTYHNIEAHWKILTLDLLYMPHNKSTYLLISKQMSLFLETLIKFFNNKELNDVDKEMAKSVKNSGGLINMIVEDIYVSANKLRECFEKIFKTRIVVTRRGRHTTSRNLCLTRRTTNPKTI